MDVYVYIHAHKEVLYVYSMMYTAHVQRISLDQRKSIPFDKCVNWKDLRIYPNTILPGTLLTKFLNCYGSFHLLTGK